MNVLLFIITSSIYTIGNSSLTVDVTDALCSVRPGSIVEINDRWTGAEITGDGQFSGINTGNMIPAAGQITLTSDTSLVFHTDHFTNGTDQIPLDLTVTYTLVGRGLEMSYRFEYLQDIEFDLPLDIDFCVSGWNSLSVQNQTTVDEEFLLDGSHGYQRFSGDQLFRLSGNNPDGVFILPNVAKGITAVTDDPGARYLSVKVLDAEPPRENAMGPDLHSIIPAGEVDEYFIRFSMDEFFAPLFISGHPDGAERSSAWMLDELPLVHPPLGCIWDYCVTSDGDEPVSAGLISLLEDHPQMKMNWLILPDAILTPNRDSVWFEPGYEDSWSHWHGTWRVCEAPADYLLFLQNIQNDVYPWADRVNMGSHGYHHTPNPDSSYGEFHEFITYEPAEHQERFRMNSLDLAACGLDSSMVRVIRFSGHRTSLSGLQAIIDHGFTFYCNGWRMTDWFAGKQFLNQWITRYQTANGRIWGSNTVWWGDYQMMYPYEYLSEVMDKGKFGLLGCHPSQMLSSYSSPEIVLAAYTRIDSVLTSLENDYDNFLWLFPSEYGDFLEDCFNINVNGINGTAPVLEMSFSGEVPQGLTLCAVLHPDDDVQSVTLDGASVPWELRTGGRLFSVLPARPQGNHVFCVMIDSTGIVEGDVSAGFGLAVVSPSSGSELSIRASGHNASSMSVVRVFDMSGRMICEDSAQFDYSYDLYPGRTLAPGIYLVTLTADGFTARARTVIIP